MQQDIEKYKVDGKYTRDTELNWLESEGILKRGQGVYAYDYALVYPKGMSDKEVSQRYFKYQKMYQDYLNDKEKEKLGWTGIKNQASQKKVMLTEEINPEEIPF